MTGLALLALGSFAAGFGRQLAPTGSSPFPPMQGAGLQSVAVIPEATPAPDMQLAAAAPTHRRAREPSGLPQITADDITPVDAPTASAEAAPAADASATAPDQPPPTPAPAPDPSEPPT